MAQAASPTSGTAIGSLLNGTYRLERVIAEGGMGVVYEAAHVRLPRRFAVKLLSRAIDKASASTALVRFRREAEIASTLAHPHVVEVFDYQVTPEGAPYLVMELLEGEDLADRLRQRGRLPIVVALRVIAEIAEALDVAHQAGVVHRDLKPANVFLSRRAGRDDFVKVLDFGVSKLVDAATLTQEKAMVGTPLYMSPEQAVGHQELTPASDIFSLGSISYETLTGRRAFAASSIPSILYQIVHGQTPKLSGRAPGLSVAVDDVFARALAKRKEERYPSARQFADELRRALGRGDLSSSDLLPCIEEPMPLMSDVGTHLLIARARLPPVPGEETDVDSSTQAGEPVPPVPPPLPMVLARSPSPPLPPLTTLPPLTLDAEPLDPDELPGATPVLRTHDSSNTLRLALGRRRSILMASAGVMVLTALVALVVLRPRARSRSATLATAAAAAHAAPRPPPATAAAGGAETGPFEPDVITAHGEVQFTFHVWPASAEIYVDERRVEGIHLLLPWSATARRVSVRAPGYASITLMASSTANRTFEMHMARATTHKKPPPARRHDAAPVQDL